jgi:hypothetical protein
MSTSDPYCYLLPPRARGMVSSGPHLKPGSPSNFLRIVTKLFDKHFFL